VPLPVYLADRVLAQVATPSEAAGLAAGLHVVPEFSGNRAPLADPDAKALIAGLAWSAIWIICWRSTSRDYAGG
jgi:ribulose kinase